MRIVSLDLETTGLERSDKISVVAIKDSTGSYIYERQFYDDEFFIKLFKGLEDALVVIHNAKFDCSFIFREFGVMLPNVFCTYMASRILNNGLNFSSSLVNCLQYYLHVSEAAHDEKKEFQRSFSGGKLTNEQREYVLADIAHLEPLMMELQRLIEVNSLTKVMALEMKLLPVLIKMETVGVRIDTKRLKRYIGIWTYMLRILTRKLDKEVTRLYAAHPQLIPPLFVSINYSSSDQVIALFKEFKQKVPTKKEGQLVKESVDYDTIQAYVNDYPKSILAPFLALLMRHREFSKLISTYGSKLLAKLDSNDYLHGDFNQLGTDTGRLSSSGPNLQNIPATGFGGRIRKCFLADAGKEMVTCDMDGAEIRIAADFSGDSLLLNSILHGTDMHSQLASVSFSLIFGYPVTISKSDVPFMVGQESYKPKELRDIHKSATFCKFYKGGPGRIYGVLSKFINTFHKKGAMSVAKQISEALDKEMSGLSQWLSGIIYKANSTKKLTGVKFNRVRYFPTEAYGDAANFPIQNCNAEAIKVAMINVDKYLRENNMGRLVMSIHDELVCSVKDPVIAGPRIQEIMADSLSYFLTSVKGEATFKIAKYWKK